MELFKIVVVVLFLGINTVLDIKYKKIPYLLCMGVSVIGIICILIDRPINMWQFLGALVGIFLMAASISTRQEIGMGDGMVLASIGLFLGFWKSLMVLFIAGVFVAIVGSIFIILKKGTLKTQLPFVPFLLIAYGVSIIL